MRGALYGLGLLLPLFWGCSGTHVVAGEEKTRAEQLESSLTSWCESTCKRLRACPAPDDCDCSGDVCNCVGVDEGCEEQCPAAFERYTGAGEECAAAGQRIQRCIDDITCNQLNGQDPCKPTAAEKDACPEPDDSDTPPSGGPNGGGDTATGSTGGSTGTSPTVGNPLVHCTDSYGSGGGAPEAGGAHVSCEEGRSGCSDGHEYSWICSVDSQGQRACSCLVDGVASNGFQPAAECPDLTAVNAGCGWYLVP
jgi:hypothetical protein